MSSVSAIDSPTHRCLISFGANIGQPAETIREAAELLRGRLTRRGTPLLLSRLFRTPPVGGPSGQPPFINAVAVAEVDGSPWEAWHAIREVEQLLGRQRQERWEARRIDLDILLFEHQRIWTPHFKVPHPRMCMRRFILEPAMDVAADWLDPVSRCTIAELTKSLRTGPASLVLIADPALRPSQLLEQASQQVRAQWCQPTLTHGPQHSPAQHSPAQHSPAQHSPAQHSPAQASFPTPTPPEAASSSNSPAALTQNSVTATAPHQRWMGWLPIDALPNLSTPRQPESKEVRTFGTWSLLPPPKLHVVLAGPTPVQGAAWEDYHRPLADWLGLTAATPHSPTHAPPTPAHPLDQGTWSEPRARYLLTAEDRGWAVHEIVAAFEAMDCPVEALPE
jgi:2-amino-4-hydroxy-6-hydroxymethyldihydropteridine diphosphokinase